MKNKKNYYAGVGLAIGTGIGGGIIFILYALTGNVLFIPFIGVGTALGLIFGAALDKKCSEEDA